MELRPMDIDGPPAGGGRAPRPERRVHVCRGSAARGRLANRDEGIALADRNGLETDGRYIRTDAGDADHAVDLAELRRHI
jgi:hypothetical protein